MDGVKISVSNEADNQEEKPSSAKASSDAKAMADKTAGEARKPVKEKAVVRKKAVRKRVIKEAAAGAKTEKREKERGILTMIISIFVTALVVGGAIYAWQSKVAEMGAEKISSDARSTRQEFEKRLDNLKKKLSGTEKEKEELLKTKQELEEKAKLLKDAKKSYVNDEMGFSFLYPAIFGEAEIETIETATGTKFIGKFSKNDKLIFGGASTNYERVSTSTAMDFIDTRGFIDEKNKYYYQPGGMDKNTDFEIQPAKIVGYRGGEALLLDKKSFVGQDEFTENAGKPFVNIDENLGGLFNLKKDEYKGVAFVNMDFGLMSIEAFTEMLKTIEVK